MGVVLIILVSFLSAYIFLIRPRFCKRAELSPYFNLQWAHRGLHDIQKGIPENSMAAFESAIRHGMPIEMDVHLTKDKKLVVFHDDTLDRMCGREGRIEELDWLELSSCRLLDTQERIPLFQDLLDLVAGQVPLLIEVKLPNSNRSICQYLVEALRSYQGKYLVQSFNSLAMYWFRKNSPETLRGQISSNLTATEKTPNYLLRFAVKYLLANGISRPDFISYKWADSKNISVWIHRIIFKTPVAVWTLRGNKERRAARGKFSMYIFEENKSQVRPGE